MTTSTTTTTGAIAIATQQVRVVVLTEIVTSTITSERTSHTLLILLRTGGVSEVVLRYLVSLPSSHSNGILRCVLPDHLIV